MKFNLSELEEGKQVKVAGEYDPAQLELEFVDLKYDGKINMNGFAEKGPDTLSFRGNLAGKVIKICGRCLKELTEDVSYPFDLYYEINDREYIDSTDDLREAILLEHALNYVCSENCKGLCPGCGVNLNSEKCKCDKKFKDKPFSQLKDVRLKFKEEG